MCQYTSVHQCHHLLLNSDCRFCFTEEVMLAEENKNPGPSALDGKSAEILDFPGFIVHIVFLLSSHCFTFCLSSTESV